MDTAPEPGILENFHSYPQLFVVLHNFSTGVCHAVVASAIDGMVF
jgi:hypothetical protein